MPEIKQQITTGNLIQIGAMLAALSVGWAMMDARGQAAQKSIDDQSTKIIGHDARIARLERDTTDRLARIETILTRIEKGMAP